MDREVAEQFVFGGGEVNQAIADLHLAACKVQLEVPSTHNRLTVDRGGSLAAQDSSDPGAQLLHSKGLDHVIVGPQVQCPDLVRLVGHHTDDDHHSAVGSLAELRKHFEAVDAWQAEIQEHNIRPP